MPNPFRHDETLPRSKINNLVFQIDQEMAVENKEELIDVIMLVPVVFALQTPSRTTESFTWHSVWLCHLSVHASTSF